MKRVNIVWYICIGGLLTIITVLFQSAPIIFPVIGLALSPFSTLPIAIAAFLNVSLGFAVLFLSFFILAAFNIQEAIILLFTTGTLGISIGILLYRKGMFISILISSIVLSLGIMCLTYIIHISIFADITSSLSIHLTFLTFFLFSLAYAAVWNICFKKFMSYLMKIKLNDKH